MKSTPKKYKMYQMLIGKYKFGAGFHYSKNEIANHMKCKLPYICEIVREWVHDGYIYCDDDHTSKDISCNIQRISQAH